MSNSYQLYLQENSVSPIPLDKENDNVLRTCDRYSGWFKPQRKESYLWPDFLKADNNYVYIFQVSMDTQDGIEKISQIFPYGNNVKPVRVNKRYYLPKENERFQLDEQIGNKELYFLAFRERNENLESQYEDVIQAKTEIDNLQLAFRNTLLAERLPEIPIYKFKHLPRDSSLVPVIEIEYSYLSEQTGRFQPLVNNESEIHDKDVFRIQFTPTEDSYVYIYQTDDSSKVLDLVEGSNLSHEVKAGTPYFVPPKPNAVAPEIIGKQTVYFFAFRNPNPNLSNPDKTQLANMCLDKCQNCVSSMTFNYLGKP